MAVLKFKYLSINTPDSPSCFLQVLHATVMKQLEIAELLESIRESKFRVSCTNNFFHSGIFMSIKAVKQVPSTYLK